MLLEMNVFCVFLVVSSVSYEVPAACAAAVVTKRDVLTLDSIFMPAPPHTHQRGREERGRRRREKHFPTFAVLSRNIFLDGKKFSTILFSTLNFFDVEIFDVENFRRWKFSTLNFSTLNFSTLKVFDDDLSNVEFFNVEFFAPAKHFSARCFF